MGNALLQGDFVEDVTVSRAAAGSYVQGVWTPGVAATFPIKACVQPMKPTEVQALNFGKRVSAAVKVYTETELRITSETAKTDGDRLSWNGATWEVMQCDHRAQFADLSHYDALAIQVEGT